MCVSVLWPRCILPILSHFSISFLFSLYFWNRNKDTCIVRLVLSNSGQQLHWYTICLCWQCRQVVHVYSDTFHNTHTTVSYITSSLRIVGDCQQYHSIICVPRTAFSWSNCSLNSSLPEVSGIMCYTTTSGTHPALSLATYMYIQTFGPTCISKLWNKCFYLLLVVLLN